MNEHGQKVFKLIVWLVIVVCALVGLLRFATNFIYSGERTNQGSKSSIVWIVDTSTFGG